MKTICKISVRKWSKLLHRKPVTLRVTALLQPRCSAEAIFVEGLKNVTAGANAMALKRGIDKAVEAVVKKLKEMSIPVKGRKEIEQVATIASNYDTEIGKIIADAMEKVGKDGVITVEEGKSLQTDAKMD